MARVTVEDCLSELSDQFALVHLATHRYRQLHRGAQRLVPSRNKDIVTALREIAAEKVRFREDVVEVVRSHKRILVSQRLQNLANGEDVPSAIDEAVEATPLV